MSYCSNDAPWTTNDYHDDDNDNDDEDDGDPNQEYYDFGRGASCAEGLNDFGVNAKGNAVVTVSNVMDKLREMEERAPEHHRQHQREVIQPKGNNSNFESYFPSSSTQEGEYEATTTPFAGRGTERAAQHHRDENYENDERDTSTRSVSTTTSTHSPSWLTDLKNKMAEISATPPSQNKQQQSKPSGRDGTTTTTTTSMMRVEQYSVAPVAGFQQQQQQKEETFDREDRLENKSLYRAVSGNKSDAATSLKSTSVNRQLQGAPSATIIPLSQKIESVLSKVNSILGTPSQQQQTKSDDPKTAATISQHQILNSSNSSKFQEAIPTKSLTTKPFDATKMSIQEILENFYSKHGRTASEEEENYAKTQKKEQHEKYEKVDEQIHRSRDNTSAQLLSRRYSAAASLAESSASSTAPTSSRRANIHTVPENQVPAAFSSTALSLARQPQTSNRNALVVSSPTSMLDVSFSQLPLNVECRNTTFQKLLMKRGIRTERHQNTNTTNVNAYNDSISSQSNANKIDAIVPTLSQNHHHHHHHNNNNHHMNSASFDRFDYYNNNRRLDDAVSESTTDNSEINSLPTRNNNNNNHYRNNNNTDNFEADSSEMEIIDVAGPARIIDERECGFPDDNEDNINHHGQEHYDYPQNNKSRNNKDKNNNYTQDDDDGDSRQERLVESGQTANNRMDDSNCADSIPSYMNPTNSWRHHLDPNPVHIRPQSANQQQQQQSEDDESSGAPPKKRIMMKRTTTTTTSSSNNKKTVSRNNSPSVTIVSNAEEQRKTRSITPIHNGKNKSDNSLGVKHAKVWDSTTTTKNNSNFRAATGTTTVSMATAPAKGNDHHHITDTDRKINTSLPLGGGRLHLRSPLRATQQLDTISSSSLARHNNLPPMVRN